MAEVGYTNHVLFKDVKYNDFFNKEVLTKLDYNYSLLYSNLSAYTFDGEKEINIEDNINWSENARGWKVKLSSSLFVSSKTYTDKESLIAWANKYLFGYLFLLLCSSTCWNEQEYSTRLYFDGFDKERLEQLHILSNVTNWETDKLDLYNNFDVDKYINKANIFTVLNKYNMIKPYIITLLEDKLITNDWQLIETLIIICGNIKNNYEFHQHNHVEIFTYDFSKYIKIDKTIYDFYVEEINNDQLSLLNGSQKFHKSLGYLGQFLRIIGTRDKSIPPNTLILIRDGHATSPSVYEKKTLIDFINSQKNIRLGINNEYTANWHKTGINGYRKGILMGYITVKNYLEDDKFYASWGKMFTFDTDGIDTIIDGIADRLMNNIKNKSNKYTHFNLESPYTYGLDEFLACNLAFDNNGLTVQKNGVFNFRTNDIDWHQILWFDNNSIQNLKKYLFLFSAILYLFCKLFMVNESYFTKGNMTLHNYMYLLISIKNNKELFKTLNKNINDALDCMFNIHNNVYYVCINSQLNTVIYETVEECFKHLMVKDKENVYTSDIIHDIFLENIKFWINNIENNTKHQIVLSNNYFNIKLKNKEYIQLSSDYYFGKNWQNEIFNTTDYFDFRDKLYDVQLTTKELIQYGKGKDDVDFETIEYYKEYIMLCVLMHIYNFHLAEGDHNHDYAHIVMDIIKMRSNIFITENIDNIFTDIISKITIHYKINNDILRNLYNYKIARLNILNSLFKNINKYVRFVSNKYVDIDDNISEINENLHEVGTKLTINPTDPTDHKQLINNIILIDILIYFVICISIFNNIDKKEHKLIKSMYEITDLYDKLKTIYSKEELLSYDFWFYMKDVDTELQDKVIIKKKIFVRKSDQIYVYDVYDDLSIILKDHALKFIKLLDIRPDDPQPDDSLPKRQRVDESQKGGYKFKYEKYKIKYLALKKQLDNLKM